MTDWSRRRLHFIAIGGAGMSGLALVCHRLGARVSGSDRAPSSYLERLKAAGLEPRVGHDADEVPPDAEVVVSTAVPEDNPELARARERGQRVLHRGELLAELCATKRLLAIAGTHGKTTTAGMLVHVLRAIGADPCLLLGGELPGAGEDGGPGNAGWGEGDWAIAEADESDASFLRLRPEVAVVTNVELDHHSQWSSRPAPGGLPSVLRAGAGPGTARRRSLDGLAGEQRVLAFDLDHPGARSTCRSRPPQPAQRALPWPPWSWRLRAGAAARALASFPGILRRLELKGHRNGAAVATTTPTTRPRSRRPRGLRELRPAPPDRGLPASPVLADEGARRRLGAALAAADEARSSTSTGSRAAGRAACRLSVSRSPGCCRQARGRPVWWLAKRLPPSPSRASAATSRPARRSTPTSRQALTGSSSSTGPTSSRSRTESSATTRWRG